MNLEIGGTLYRNMSKPFNNLIEKMPVERQERIKQKAKNLKTQMALGELRRALELTQEQVAGALDMNQAAISKFEHQSDIYIGTLRRILLAMGAELRIIAHFPDTDVVIDQFAVLQKGTTAKRKAIAKGSQLN
jgi:DNA-binding transcriptional regulator YiaG